MFVKICGVTSEEDALLAVALGADAVGFVFAPSPRQIAVDRARDIARRLPFNVLTVGVFRNHAPAQVMKTMTRASLRAAQLHGDEAASDTAWVAERLSTTIKAFPAGHPGLGRLDDYQADIVMIDSHRPGSGEMFDWSLAEDAPLAGHRLLLAGGLDSDNVATAIRLVRPWGVDVSTGVESSPGRKDPTRMRTFIQRAKEAVPDDGADESPTRGMGESGLYDWETSSWEDR